MDTDLNNRLINRLFCFSFEIWKAPVPKNSDDQKATLQYLRKCLSRAPESRTAFIAPIPGSLARKARCSPFRSHLGKRILGFVKSAPFLLLIFARAGLPSSRCGCFHGGTDARSRNGRRTQRTLKRRTAGPGSASLVRCSN